MSIETVEIRAFSGPSVVEINGSDQPAIVEINQGPAGAAGPNEITTATTTDLTGYIFGDGSFIAGATTATADPDPSTLVLRDSLGEAEFEGLRVNPGGSPDGDFDVGGGVFNVDMQTLSASCSGTFTASDVQATTATVSGTLTADHIHGNLAGSVYAHVRAGETLTKGDPVYVSGSHGTGANLIAIVSKADASDPLKMPAVGVMDAAVANNANGHMVITGTISDINTATYSVNSELYVAEGGGFTATPPSAYAQPVARVERSNTNNGAVIVKVNGLSASDATGNALVRRTSTGGASFGSLTLTNALALSSGGTGGTTAGTARTNLGLGTADTPTFSNLTLNTGTITVPQPLSFSQTWNAAAMTFSAFQMNVTDTLSASGSLLMDLRVGGVSRMAATKGGRIILSNSLELFSNSGDLGVQSLNGASWKRIVISDVQFANHGVIITSDSANTLAQRNGTNAQESRVYGTYTSATNFERLNLKYNGTATAFQIGTEKGSAGGTARPLEFQTDGTTRMTIGADGQSSLTQTWNAAGTTFKALDVNITDTASASGSLLMDLRVGGVSKLTVDKSGFIGINNGFIQSTAVGRLDLLSGTTQRLRTDGNGVLVSGYLSVGQSIGANEGRLYADAANTLAQRNGTNAQVTRVYDTYTSATDYHRLAIATARATATAMSGATVTLTDIIPAGAVVVGVTCKVTTAITGATSFDIGTATDVDRFGAAIAVALGTTSDNRNWTAGTIECFPTATSLILTANGSNFTAGAVYVSVQYLSGQAD